MTARAGVLVAALALLLSGCGTGDSRSAADHRATQISFACSNTGVTGDHGADVLPPGATAALICATDGDQAWVAPHEPLTHQVDQLVALVDRQRLEHNPNGVCNLAGGPAWSLLVRYPDGVRRIDGDDGGCNTLFVGPTEKEGARRVYWAFARALLRQRSHQHPPGAVTHAVPPCPSHQFVFVPTAEPRLLSRGSWCLRDDRTSHSDGPLTQTQLRVLRHDLATLGPRSSRRPDVSACRARGGATGQVSGRDVWDDPVRIDFECGYYLYSAPASRHTLFVRMLPATEAMVSALP